MLIFLSPSKCRKVFWLGHNCILPNRFQFNNHTSIFFLNWYSGGVESNWVHSTLRPLIGLLCHPGRVSMMMEKLVEWLAGETEVLYKNLFQAEDFSLKPTPQTCWRTIDFSLRFTPLSQIVTFQGVRHQPFTLPPSATLHALTMECNPGPRRGGKVEICWQSLFVGGQFSQLNKEHLFFFFLGRKTWRRRRRRRKWEDYESGITSGMHCIYHCPFIYTYNLTNKPKFQKMGREKRCQCDFQLQTNRSLSAPLVSYII
jgi:hypothetical protein